MSSSLWYLYEFVRKKWVSNFTCAKTDIESTIPQKRYRKIPVIVELPEKCISCGACAGACPCFAIEMVKNDEHNKELPVIDDNSCITCALCVESCPTGVLDIGTVREDTDGRAFSIPKYTNLIIDEELCVNCGLCKKACPVNAIDYNEKSHYIIDNDCIECMECIKVCPVQYAIKTYDEKLLKEKFDKTQYLKYDRLIKLNDSNEDAETNDNTNNTDNSNGDIDADITTMNNEDMPRIVKSLCIKCYNCVDVCPDGVDLDNYTVNTDNWDNICLEVCPTTAMRIGTAERIAKITDKCYIVNEDACIGCRICYKVCGVDNTINISSETRMPYINPKLCVRCGLCESECPVNAIDLIDTKVVENTYEIRKVKDEFRNVIRRDLDEFSKKYMASKSEIKKTMEKTINKSTS